MGALERRVARCEADQLVQAGRRARLGSGALKSLTITGIILWEKLLYLTGNTFKYIRL